MIQGHPALISWLVGHLHNRGPRAPRFLRETTMEDFPLWLKIVIYATIGLTVLYTAWGIIRSLLGA